MRLLGIASPLILTAVFLGLVQVPGEASEDRSLPPQPLPPQETGPQVLGSKELDLRFRIEERGAAEIVGAILHYTLDGGVTWISQETKRNGSTIRFQAPRDGRFGFRLTAVDASGARGQPPAPGERPDLEAIVDTTPPAIRILRPVLPEQVSPDGRVEIEWAVRDENIGEAPLEVSASQDGGPWGILWPDAPLRGKKSWNVPLLPGELRLRFRAKDRAGNVAELITPAVFKILEGGAQGPRWIAVPPQSRSRRVPIYYRLVPDGDPGSEGLPPEEVGKVVLHYRSGGLEWSEGPTDPDRRSPIIFEAPRDGMYEILLIAQDRSGRPLPRDLSLGSDGKPDFNASPHARFLVDTTEPRVAIEAPAEGAWIEAGSSLTIRYTVEEENPQEKSVSILSSLDGGVTWTAIAEGLEPVSDGKSPGSRGEFRFAMPLIESESFLLKVQAEDGAGNIGEASTDRRKPLNIRNPRENLSRKAEELYRRGILDLRSADPKDREKAIESFRRALTYDPGHAAAHHDLAVVLEGADPGKWDGSAQDESLTHFRKASSLSGDHPRFAMSLVGALIRRAARRNADVGKDLLEEAGEIFRKISWTRLVEVASEDAEESQRLRRQYKEWKEVYFKRIPR